MTPSRHYDVFFQGPERSRARYTLLWVLATWGVYFAWLWPRTWFQDGGGIFAGLRGVAWSWPEHSALASVFAYRSPETWFLGHPQAADAPLGGGFVADALAGFLIRAGLDHGWALMLTALAFTLLFLAMLALFYRAALDRTDPTWFAVTLFLCAGGLGFVHYLQDLVQPLLGADPSWLAFRDNLLSAPDRSYTEMPQHGLVLGNPVIELLLVQRDLLLGMALALGLLAILLHWYRDGFEYVGPVASALLGLGFGLLAAVHGGSLAASAVVVLAMALTSPGAWRHWFLIVLMAVAVALPLLQFLHGDLARLWMPLEWKPGGLATAEAADQRPWLLYWWDNRGLFLPVAVAALLVNRWWGHPAALAGVVLFALVNLVQPDPALGENAVFLAWAQLLLVIPVAHFLGEMRRTIPLGAIPAFLLAGVLIASGALDLWRAATTRAELVRVWGPVEIALAEQFRDLSEPTDEVAVALTTRPWPAELTGRPSRVLVDPTARLPGWGALAPRLGDSDWLVTETSALT
ncbi:MAG: hypothetical protein R3298_11100, partial [Gammaproteobacteria bacterium]|nr:hypothetical protein [Gammaproteobacteria bacterium]